MKKSRVLKLMLMGAVLTGCSDGPVTINQEARLFKTVPECALAGAKSGEMTLEECRLAFANAKKAHQEEAPKYASKEACENDFGADNCEAQSGSSDKSSWRPYLVGAMIGSMMTNKQQRFVAQPLYSAPGSAPGSSFRTAGDSTPMRNNAAGHTSLTGRQIDGMKKTAVSQNPSLAGKPMAVSRGGFGARASVSSSSGG